MQIKREYFFKKGNKYGKGSPPGTNNGGGLKPNWYKHRCAEILSNKNLFGFLGDVASGEKIERTYSLDGKTVYKIPAKIRDRIDAITELRDTAYGRPSQHVDVTNDKALMELLSYVSLLIKQHVPIGCPHCKKKLGILEILAREFYVIQEKYQLKDKSADGPI